MAGIPKEHNTLYFDTLRRTQKAETILALILATDHAWKKSSNPEEVKQEIATRLVGAYNLMIDPSRRGQQGSGTYTGTAEQFSSQYTIGHEMCIWTRRDLKLTSLAQKVADFDITIKKYFDIFFLNYFQPINGKAIHPLYLLLCYMKKFNKLELSHEDIRLALNVDCSEEGIRSLINFLIDTSYFKLGTNNRNLLYVSNENIDSLISKCNQKYLGSEGLELARKELDTDEKYESYIFTLPEENTITNSEEDNDDEINNKDLFINYITNIKKHAPNYIRAVLRVLNKINEMENVYIYEIFEADKITALSESVLKKEYWIERNSHNEISAALNKYKEFLIYTYGGIITRKTSEVLNNNHKKRVGKVNDLNIILYGPPGTGKTYAMPELALACIENRKPRLKGMTSSERNIIKTKYDKLVSEGQIVFTTFHQNYGYEDFIEGLKPTTIDGNVTFNVEKGIFVKISDLALANPDKEYVIIIDEINRGNISRIFGELITLIEEDKRFGEDNFVQITLPFGDQFFVPNNLYIIGTMNSADKSISLIDVALRRRFTFINIEPNKDLINEDLRNIFVTLNRHLSEQLRSSDLLIGHSYFIGKTINDIESIFNQNVIPLLYEYFYDDKGQVIRALDCLNEICSIEDPIVGRISVKRKNLND